MANDPEILEKDKPPEVEIPEERFRSYLKDKYGIEDDPDTYKGRVTKWKEAEESVPQFQTALVTLYQRLQARELGIEKDAPPVKDEPEVDFNQLREFAKYDPLGAMAKWDEIKSRKATKERETQHAQLMEAVRREVGAGDIARTAAEQLRAQWPEAYDKDHELHKMGREIYWRELSPAERQSPNSFLRAAEVAAARLGLPPKSKRVAPKEVDVDAEVDAQDVSSNSKKPRKDPEDNIKVSEREKKMLSVMGLDEKTFKKVRAANKAGRDLKGE